MESHTCLRCSNPRTSPLYIEQSPLTYDPFWLSSSSLDADQVLLPFERPFLERMSQRWTFTLPIGWRALPLNVHPRQLSTKVPYRAPIRMAACTVLTVGVSISISKSILARWLYESPGLSPDPAEYRLTPLSVLIIDARASIEYRRQGV